jgi:hypothetical protein
VEVEALQKGYKRDAPGWASGRVDEQKIQWQLFLVRFSYIEWGFGRGAPLLPFCLFLRPSPGPIDVVLGASPRDRKCGGAAACGRGGQATVLGAVCTFVPARMEPQEGVMKD